MSRVKLTFRVKERVRVEGHDGVFVAVQVNAERGWADLACVDRIGFLMHVPLEKIRPADHKDG